MKNKAYLILPILCLLYSCNKPKHDYSYLQDKNIIDSIIVASNNIDSLNIYLQKFSKSGNAFGIMATCKELGKRYRIENKFIEAIESHRKGIRAAQEICDTITIIQSLNDIGTNFRRMGILDEASSYHYQALSYCEMYSDKESYIAKKNLVISLNGIGNVHLTLGNNEVADSVFRLALAGEKELDSPLGQAINYANIGSIFESKGELDSARYYYNLSMVLNMEAKSDLGISLCHTHIGRLYEKNRQWDKAITEYTSAYNIMENKSDRWHWLESCLSIARIYINKGELEQAREYLSKAKTISEEINSIEHISEVHRLYYLLYEKEGNCKKALDNFVLSKQYADSLSSIKNINHLQNVRAKYERERQQKEIFLIQQNYQTKQRSKNILIIACLSTLLLATVIIIFLWYVLKMKSKNQHFMKQMEEIRANFFTNITHEFRTPLTVILGLGKQLEKGKAANGQTIQDIGKVIIRQGGNLLNLINQLLDITKIKSAIGEPDWRCGDIVSYLRMLIESYQEYARQKCIELVFAPSQLNITMDFVPDYINKIMRNLISNALKFTDKYGNIYITIKQIKDKIELIVADTGIGIDQEEIPNLFKPFYRGSNSKMEIGTGIGLSLVYQMVKAMDGDITIKSTKGEGSIFTIVLSLKHGDKHWSSYICDNKDFNSEDFAISNREDFDISNNIISQSDDTNANRQTPMILIIEDNSDISYYIGTQLQDNYNLFYGHNGEEGLKKAKELIPDLIITDLMMPGMDGYELCKSIRSSELLNHIPIIIITAKCTEADKIKGIEAGADAYLYKPFNSDELKIRIEKLLESRILLQTKYSKALQEGIEESIELSQTDRNFLNKIIDIAYLQMMEGEINSESIASKMCMSSSQLRRKIFAITGETTSSYLLKIRIGKAKRLLDSPEEIPIGDIAVKCGFYDVAHFSKIFKQSTQMTPTQFRKRVKS